RTNSPPWGCSSQPAMIISTKPPITTASLTRTPCARSPGQDGRPSAGPFSPRMKRSCPMIRGGRRLGRCASSARLDNDPDLFDLAAHHGPRTETVGYLFGCNQGRIGEERIIGYCPLLALEKPKVV